MDEEVVDEEVVDEEVVDGVLMLGFSIGFSSLFMLSELSGSDETVDPVNTLFFGISLRSILLPRDGRS